MEGPSAAPSPQKGMTLYTVLSRVPITETGFGLCWVLLERTMREPCAGTKSIYRNHARTMRGPFLLVGPSLASFWGYHCCCLSNSSNSSSVAAAAAVLLPQQDQCCCLSSSSNSSSVAAAAAVLLLQQDHCCSCCRPRMSPNPCANHAQTMREPCASSPTRPWMNRRPVGGQLAANSDR